MKAKLTDFQLKALQAIADHGPLRPRELARHLWPDSDGWRRHSNVGQNGSAAGVGMSLAGGAYLGKMRKRGWVVQRYSPYDSTYFLGYVLTHAGREALKDEQEKS